MMVSVLDVWVTPPDKHMSSPRWARSLRHTHWSLHCKLVQTGHLLQNEPTCDVASPARPPKCTGCELILYSKEPRDSLEIKKIAQGWVWKAPKGLSLLNTNWQESPTVRATGRGNSPPQHPGWAAYVWMDIFRHCARFLSLYLYFTHGINMANV